MFDMTQCKIGDKLVTRGGNIVELLHIDNCGSASYPYKLSDGHMVTPKGYIWLCYPDEPENVIGFANEKLIQAPPTTISIRKEERFFITVNGTEVEITLEELYNLQHQINELVGEE